MEFPAGALGLSAPLMNEVDCCIQNAVGKPSASFVLDRADVTSSPPVLFKSNAVIVAWSEAGWEEEIPACSNSCRGKGKM